MKEIIKIIKILFFKKKFIATLCEEEGCPQGVAKQLKKLKNKYPFLPIKKELKKFEIEAEEWDKTAYEDYLISQDLANFQRGGCYDCPWGNGEGGCTIPDCCY